MRLQRVLIAFRKPDLRELWNSERLLQKRFNG